MTLLNQLAFFESRKVVSPSHSMICLHYAPEKAAFCPEAAQQPLTKIGLHLGLCGLKSNSAKAT